VGEERRYYLEDIALDEAIRRYGEALEAGGCLAPADSEVVPLDEALGRVTAEPVWAVRSSPHYHAAAMDGVAIRSEDSEGASETSPVRLRIGEQAEWIDTGRPLPEGCDAVVMIENVQQVGDGEIEIMAAVAPWQHVRALGEDMVSSELVLSEGQRLRSVDLGAIAQSGAMHVAVRRRPRVAIIPTGTELVAPGEDLKPGSIIESNSLMLAGMVREWGGEPTRFAPVADDYDKLGEALQEALKDHDIVVMNAGASAGRRDYTASLVADAGEVVVHGVAIRPGHPVVLGLANGRAVIGTPGYPVSASLTMELFVKPIIYSLLGLGPPQPEKTPALMTRKVFSPLGEDEFLRVKLGKVGDKVVAVPLQRGAGVTMSLVRADGRVRIPRGSEGIHEGQEVEVELLRSLEEIENAVVVIGSHDLALDVLANHLRRRYPGRSLSSSNVGSLGGLLAVQRGEAHLAGSHLMDEETGEYNVTYVKRLLADRRVVLVNLVYRKQGLMVAKGNPKEISSLNDLLRPDVSVINRQRGSGTRVLLDFKLKQLGMDPSRIRGYQRVEFTHLAVASAVAAGTADAGLGILAAARALGLDFLPLMDERYDLVIPQVFYESDLLRPLLDVLQTADFRSDVEALGGYDVSEMGRVVAEF